MAFRLGAGFGQRMGFVLYIVQTSRLVGRVAEVRYGLCMLEEAVWGKAHTGHLVVMKEFLIMGINFVAFRVRGYSSCS